MNLDFDTLASPISQIFFEICKFKKKAYFPGADFRSFFEASVLLFSRYSSYL